MIKSRGMFYGITFKWFVKAVVLKLAVAGVFIFVVWNAIDVMDKIVVALR